MIHAPESADAEGGSNLCKELVLVCKDGVLLSVDRRLLAGSSRVFQPHATAQDLLSACAAERIHVEETSDVMRPVLDVLQGILPVNTYHMATAACWTTFEHILRVVDKYDMPFVKERAEWMLVSRCLRGRVMDPSFKFQELAFAKKWLLLCQLYNLKQLGWYVAYDVGGFLQQGQCKQPIEQLLLEVHDAELVKVILKAYMAGTSGGSA